MKFQSLMRWGTYSDPPLRLMIQQTRFVSIAHALGNLFRPHQLAIDLAADWQFQSLMRWGTYSDKVVTQLNTWFITGFNRSCVGEPIPTNYLAISCSLTLGFNRSCVGEPIPTRHLDPPTQQCGRFQSLMRWGTYSDKLQVGTLHTQCMVSIAHALGNLFRQVLGNA